MRVNMVDEIKKYISIKPSLADNDLALMWAIWANQLKKINIDIDQLSARDLMYCWKNKQVTSPFNISRSRRKCQEHYPETRGEIYYERRKKQDDVKSDLRREEAKQSRQRPINRRTLENGQ